MIHHFTILHYSFFDVCLHVFDIVWLQVYKTRIKRVAVCLQDFLKFLDKYGIAHRSSKAIRKKLKRNKKSMLRMKQYFLRGGLTVTSAKVVQRGLSVCKACICFPQDMMEASWEKLMQSKRNLLWYNQVELYLCLKCIQTCRTC